MLDQNTMWQSIDVIAERKGLSLQRLALMADMDQSMFSYSRRDRAWPSLRTLAQLLNAADISIIEWANIVRDIENGKTTGYVPKNAPEAQGEEKRPRRIRLRQGFPVRGRTQRRRRGDQ